ncbi:TPA: LuxR C-terminal-related transcriptional regulator [Pseudomonas aeruginosa]|uniref:response regulator transcription factor n=1 Tax=Pseudomonas aeruginosa TaxID=287 RepID=UPI000F8944CF|nr:response regulator transcription factor [Pseudomonas aeruginosa]ELK4895602.1 response regulator transcription factor [Pseudomonas aeruginosa]MBI9218596.1 response regulator transcription factor [Pseudomonas aeruginosa]MCS7718134.1 response regulator transcription factor [Pseudomonas aeruginosa]MCS9527073.1 response regulator transcription factor [Pseudomonas aeruginosa]MCS9586317.1 response regulator transcription factor [Pseudomonas aeruginosa]
MSSNETLPGLVIADSFPVMQWALQRYLSEECGRQVLAVVGDSDSLVERLADLPPESILITELGLPGQRSRDGIHLVEWLTRHCPQMKVMVYSVFSAPLLAKAVLRSGASAYISKRSPLETLKAALECMALGQTFLDPGLHPQRHTGKPLSPTEVDILWRLARGDTVSEIAQRTMRSVSTISTHKKNAMVKIGLNSDAELIALGVMNWLHELA